MGSRRQTRGEGARVLGLSRRAVGARPYERWLRLNARIERLETRWAKLEDWLVREHSWHRLSPAEQQALPWAGELRDIDGRLDVLFEQRGALLEALPARGCATLEAVAAKLAVVERLIAPDDYRVAHAMIAGARQDLMTLINQD